MALRGHFGQGWFARRDPRPVGLVTHVRGLEQSQQVPRAVRIHLSGIVALPHVLRSALRGQPFVDQVASIAAAAHALRIFRIRRSCCRSWFRVRRRAPPRCHRRSAGVAPAARRCPAASHPAAIAPRTPRTVGRMGIVGGRRGIRDPRGGHDARCQAALLGLLQQRRQGLLGNHRAASATFSASVGATDNAPSLACQPVTMAVAVGAESGICWLAVNVRTRAVCGKSSKLRRLSSPDCPRRCPSRMRAAVMVVMPMPSPTKRITLRAGGPGRGVARLRCSTRCAALS